MTSGRSMPLPIIILLMLGIVVLPGPGPASTAVNHVRKGIELFSGGDYDAAVQAFTEADVAEPENPVILFDRACALAAAGDHEKAKELYLEAALARDASLASDAHYNLGGLSAAKGQAALGEDPVAAQPAQREEGIRLLLTAVAHYRDCLNLKPDHDDARHNLELIRLFIKNIQAQWEQQDREKAREEMGLLEFLAMIEKRQAELRSAAALVAEQPDSPQQRQAASEIKDSQNSLQEEIEPLKDKLRQEFQAAQQTPQNPATPGNPTPGATPPDNSQNEQALKLLNQLADEAGGLMTAAANDIEAAEFDDANTRQRDVLDRLNQIFMAVAPFTDILQRAIQQQEQLVQTSESLVAASASNLQDTDTEPDEPGSGSDDSNGRATVDDSGMSDVDFPELGWRQNQITDWSRMLSLKAESELPQVEAQLQNARSQSPPSDPATTPPNNNPGTTPPQTTQPDPVEQLEGMQKSMEKAVELAPQVVQHSESATTLLENSKPAEALPIQRKALELLREIAEPLPKQDQSQDNQQDGEGDNEQEDQQQEQENQNQQQGQNENQQQNPDQQQQQEQQSQQERAMSALRRAREREREHRDLQKQLQEIMGGRVRVDRDW